MSEKVQKILTRLGNIWPKRIDDDTLGEWLADWESALKQFDPWVIDAAATRIVHDRTSDRFPLPADVRRICFQVLAEDRASKPRFDGPKSHGDPYALAKQLIQSEIGRRAAREGWVLTLRDFIVREGRLPTEGEVGKLVGIRNTFLNNLRDRLNGLGKLGMSMAKREHDLARDVLGPSAPDWYADKIGRAAA